VANPAGAPRVSIILPVKNQADHIELIVSEYVSALRQIGELCELILVENGSTDATGAACAALAALHHGVAAVASGAGWGRAVRAGISNARGDLLCFTNSARTTPEDLALAVRYGLVNERVVVKASRKMRASLVRRIGSLLFNLQARMLFGMAIWDINGTPKVFHRELLPLLALRENGDLLDLEFAIACHRHQIAVLEMPIFAVRRHGGKSSTNWRSAFRIYAGTFRLYWSARRRSRSTAASPVDSSNRMARRFRA